MWTEGTAISVLGEKNRAASVKWKSLGQDEREKYQQLAAQIPTESSAPGPSTHYHKWHETQRVLRNLQGNVRMVVPYVHLYKPTQN